MERNKTTPWKFPGKYDVSPYNYSKEVVADYEFPAKIPICDATIRKIDNTPGSLIPYSVEDKLEIAAMLDEMGVAELGCNPMHFYGTLRNDAIREGLSAIAKKGFNFKITALMNWGSWEYGPEIFQGHADRILDMGAPHIDVEGPGSDFFLETYLPNWTWDQVQDSMARAVEYVRGKGMEAGVVLPDIVRGDLDRMISIMNFLLDHGAQRFFFCDSFSCLSPEGTRYLIKKVYSGLTKRVPIIYHPHDDTGLATAQALAAAAAGAWPEASVNGIGERAFLKLEEYVLALELLYGVDTGTKLDKISGLCKTVERITGIRNQPHKPVVGETMYVPLFEAEYVDLLKGGAYASTAFDPSIVGEKPNMVWWEGMLSPTTARAKLNQLEIPHTDEQLDKAIDAIRARLQELKEFPAWIPDAEAGQIIRRSLG